MVSMMGNTQMDSRIDVPMYVSCSHWHALKMDIKMQVWRTSVSDATLKRLAVAKLATLRAGTTASQPALVQTFGSQRGPGEFQLRSPKRRAYTQANYEGAKSAGSRQLN